jgi:CRISPR-associated protein Cmr1
MPKPSDIPHCPVVALSRSSDRETRDYQISLITPLFGGGVEASIPDETLPIRGTSIRGQLQFWWRATRGGAFVNREDLFVCHAAIWGCTDKASPVEITVRDVTAADQRPCATYAFLNDGKLKLRWQKPFADSTALQYALFPFQGKLSQDPKAVEQAPAQFIESASFTLRLSYPPTLRQEVETAVWAWVNFGGLGARTRRGCGSLLCKELAPNDLDDCQRWFRTTSFHSADNAREWPTMPSGVLAGAPPEDYITAWKKAIGLLQEFRQRVGIARNARQQNRPGRSRYPEPETVRRITGKRSVQHRRLAHIPDDAFPRAEFGLPIIFHFQGQGEPPDTTLCPSNAQNGGGLERMASPLILKPLALASGKAVPLILRLVTLPLEAVELKQGSRYLATSAVRSRKLATYENSPLSGAASGSAIEAFLLHAQQSNNGFREVTR